MASPPRSVERRYNRRTGALPGFSSAADQSHLSSASSTRQDSFKPSSDVGSWIHERRTLHALKLRRRRLVRTTEPNLLKALQTALLQAWYFGKGVAALSLSAQRASKLCPVTWKQRNMYLAIYILPGAMPDHALRHSAPSPVI